MCGCSGHLSAEGSTPTKKPCGPCAAKSAAYRNTKGFSNAIGDGIKIGTRTFYSPAGFIVNKIKAANSSHANPGGVDFSAATNPPPLSTATQRTSGQNTGMVIGIIAGSVLLLGTLTAVIIKVTRKNK